jgi:hypothetical protein
MALTIEDITEDKVSLDNIQGGDGSNNTCIVPNFMPAARDIMNQFPTPTRLR